MKQQARTKGFTLIEMLLVMVIISSVIYMGIGYIQQRTLQERMDRTVAQMQQILNAGLSYYVSGGTSSWPSSISSLQPNYLPSTLTSPWGTSYSIKTTGSNLYVIVQIPAGIRGRQSIANVIAGKLPLAYTSVSIAATPPVAVNCAAAGNCYVVASVNIPAQSLTNAGSVNFAGLYHHGGCVPVPTCPVDASGNAMTAQIMVVPVSVSGMNDPNSPNLYPISSFTAYAVGGVDSTPYRCNNGSYPSTPPCGATVGSAPSSGKYWRVCLQVVTEKGDVALTSASGTSSPSYPFNPWGGNVTLMAITRCAISNEPSGSSFNVFTQ